MLLEKRWARGVFDLWARWGRAPGYRYQAIDRWGPLLHEQGLTRELRGGLQMECDLRDHVQRQIFFYGAYEPIDAYLFAAQLEPGMNAFDVGANVGFYTLLSASRVGQQGRVVAFEPVPSNFEALRRSVSRNRLDERVQLVPQALWHRRETLRLSRTPEQDGNQGTYSAASRTEAVLDQFSAAALPLDDWMAEAGEPARAPHLLKMDIEGAELMALQGAQATLARFKPRLLIEIQPSTCARFGYTPAELWRFLQGLGYEAWAPGLSSKDWKCLPDLQGVEDNVFFFSDGLPAVLASLTWDYKSVLRFWRETADGA